MTRTFWTILVIVVLMVVIGVGVVYRSQLQELLQKSNTESEEATTTEEQQGPLWQQYATTTYQLQYPQGYTLNTEYVYDQFGQAKLIHGISLTIPPQMATGTNLGSDTRLSLEQLPRAKNCTGDIYINADVKATKMSENGSEYSLASTTGAGAGNRYEEVVYALVGSSPCTAVRYFIHYSAIENYPAGAVREFDRVQLMAEFDQIRRSLSVGAPTPAATSPQP